MKCAILQPGYIPWLGYFDLMYRTDVFVFLDDAQMTIRDWRTRNRIRTRNGWRWLSIPIDWHNNSYRNYRICDVGVKGTDWVQSHLGTLKQEYKGAPHLKDVIEILEGSISISGDNLALIDRNIILSICNYINLECITFDSKNLRSKVCQKSIGLLQIIKAVRELGYPISSYISGPTAKDYLRKEYFNNIGVEVEWHNYTYPFYNTPLSPFISYLSILDILMYYGEDSLDIVTGKVVIPKPQGVQVVKVDDFTA